MAVWLVRAGRNGENESFALENNVVCIGWDMVPDMSTFKAKEDMRAKLEEVYPNGSKAYISNILGQLWAFKERIQHKDIVVLPLKTRSGIALGNVTGPYEHKPDNPEDALHTRPVEWIRTDVPRDTFGQDLLYSLGAFMTVCQIRRNEAEARIKSILAGKPDPHGAKKPTTDDRLEADATDAEAQFDLEQYAQDVIRNYINARFSGHNFANLVAEVLKAQGFAVHVSQKGPDGGVDIIAGKGPMGIDQPRLCVQVKSGGTVDVTPVRELRGVLANFGANTGLFVSWDGFTISALKEARKQYFDIRLWDADDFIKALLENYEKLSDVTKAELPLKRIWTLVLDNQK